MSLKWISEVYLLAENRLLREALVRLLGKKDIRVVGASPYSEVTLEEIVEKKPKIIVLDSSGLAFSNSTFISVLRSAMAGVRIVMVDMESDESTFLRAVREGIVGYVLKDASAVEVAATIRAVAAGEAVCPTTLCMALFRSVSQQPDVKTSTAWDAGLSRRERELVELLSARLTNKEIATQLNLSEQTVKNHVHNILRKLGAPDRLSVIKLFELDRLREAS